MAKDTDSATGGSSSGGNAGGGNNSNSSGGGSRSTGQASSRPSLAERAGPAQTNAAEQAKTVRSRLGSSPNIGPKTAQAPVSLDKWTSGKDAYKAGGKISRGVGKVASKAGQGLNSIPALGLAADDFNQSRLNSDVSTGDIGAETGLRLLGSMISRSPQIIAGLFGADGNPDINPMSTIGDKMSGLLGNNANSSSPPQLNSNTVNPNQLNSTNPPGAGPNNPVGSYSIGGKSFDNLESLVGSKEYRKAPQAVKDSYNQLYLSGGNAQTGQAQLQPQATRQSSAPSLGTIPQQQGVNPQQPAGWGTGVDQYGERVNDSGFTWAQAGGVDKNGNNTTGLVNGGMPWGIDARGQNQEMLMRRAMAVSDAARLGAQHAQDGYSVGLGNYLNDADTARQNKINTTNSGGSAKPVPNKYAINNQTGKQYPTQGMAADKAYSKQQEQDEMNIKYRDKAQSIVDKLDGDWFLDDSAKKALADAKSWLKNYNESQLNIR